MKLLRLVDYFVCLFVFLFVLFLGLKLQSNNTQLHYFSQVPKRFTIFFINFYFNTTLHFIFNFTLFFWHSFYYEFILTGFMTVTSEQDVFVAP